MKSLEEIRKEESQKCETYTLSQIKMNIIFYNFVRLFFTKIFFFLFYLGFIYLLLSFLNIDLTSKLIIGGITHFVCFVIAHPIISKFTETKDTVQEIDELIKVNKEFIKTKKGDK
jgi:hypothetical protein